jgi:hypothetical protein
LPKSEVIVSHKDNKVSKDVKDNDNCDNVNIINDRVDINGDKIDKRKISPPKNRIFNSSINNNNRNINTNNKNNNNNDNNKAPLTCAQIAYEEELQSRFGDRRRYLPKKQSEAASDYGFSNLDLNSNINNNNMPNRQHRKGLLLSKYNHSQSDNNLEENNPAVGYKSSKKQVENPSLNINLNTSPLTNHRKIVKQTINNDINKDINKDGNKVYSDGVERDNRNDKQSNEKSKKERKSTSPNKKQVIINIMIPIDIQRVRYHLIHSF